MTNKEKTLRIEVIGGPMDGLKSILERNALNVIGNNRQKKTKNALSLNLIFDEYVGGQHAKIVHFENKWLIYDLTSINGSWFCSDNGISINASFSNVLEKITPDKPITVKEGSIIILGKTVLAFFLECEENKNNNASKEPDFYINPLENYQFNYECKEIWNDFYKNEHFQYCDVTTLFKLLKKRDNRFKNDNFVCGNKISRAFNWKELCEQWPENYNYSDVYNFFSEKKVISLRVIDIFDNIIKKKKINSSGKIISPNDIYQEIIDERKSVVAKFMEEDEDFLNKFSLRKSFNQLDICLLEYLQKFDSLMVGFIRYLKNDDYIQPFKKDLDTVFCKRWDISDYKNHLGMLLLKYKHLFELLSNNDPIILQKMNELAKT